MEEFLGNIYSNSTLPVWSAFILGLMTAISPCPLATNITAIGFIGRNLENRNRVFYNGIIYTSGRASSYTVLAFILYTGANIFSISAMFQKYGEKFLGPLLIIMGIFMLGIIKIRLPGLNRLTGKYQHNKTHSYLDVFLLGAIFALAFCPYSGVLYFGLLVPMTIHSASGLYLPVVFAAATGIPVIILSWLLAYTVSGAGRFYNRIKTIERWFRRLVAVLFIGVGAYYTIIIWL